MTPAVLLRCLVRARYAQLASPAADSDNCGSGLYCIACARRASCRPTPLPEPHRAAVLDRHECAQCVQAADCPGGMFCSPSGACVTVCDSSMPCAGAKSCCSGRRHRTTSDYLQLHGLRNHLRRERVMLLRGRCLDAALPTPPTRQCGTACVSTARHPACTSAVQWTGDAGWSHCAAGNTAARRTSRATSNAAAAAQRLPQFVRHSRSPTCTNSSATTRPCNPATSTATASATTL